MELLILELFEKCYNHLFTLKGYKKPILREGVELQYLQKFKTNFFFPSELEDLYLKYDGIIEPQVGEENLVDFYISPMDGYFLPISECEVHIKQIIELETMVEKEFGRSLLGNRKDKCFPFIHDGHGGYLLIMDTNEVVHYYGNCADDNLTVLYKNIKDFFKTLYICFEKNYFYLDKNGLISFDFASIFKEIAILNPEISYWKLS